MAKPNIKRKYSTHIYPKGCIQNQEGEKNENTILLPLFLSINIYIYKFSPYKVSFFHSLESSKSLLLQWIKDQVCLRVFLGALIQGVPAMANLHKALTCSGKAYSMPTRGPISIFSGSGPSKSSKPPAPTCFTHFRAA